jgi:predicted phosphodiesterase
MASGAEPTRPQRLLVQSDQHIEQSDWRLPRKLPAHDVAVFAGDVSSPLAASLLLLARERDAGIGLSRDIVLVPGNHEYYGADVDDALAEGRVLAARLGIHLLDGDEAAIGGVRYLGTTLWTDYELYGNAVAARHAAAAQMNDHNHISRGAEGFSPADALALHRDRLAWLESRLAVPHAGATVVVTHHCPSPASVPAKYAGDALNPAFASNLDGLIRAHGPDLWIHGHTHSSFDYRIGGTRVLCNPKGYGPRNGRAIENREFRPRLVVEVPEAS